VHCVCNTVGPRFSLLFTFFKGSENIMLYKVVTVRYSPENWFLQLLSLLLNPQEVLILEALPSSTLLWE